MVIRIKYKLSVKDVTLSHMGAGRYETYSRGQKLCLW